MRAAGRSRTSWRPSSGGFAAEHLHSLALDGGFTRGADGALVFHEVKGLRQNDLARVAARTAARVTAMLARRGLGPGSQADQPTDEPDLLTTLHAAPVTERVPLGPKAGWRITQVGAGVPHTAAVRVPPSAATLLAEADGDNVHAGASGCPCVRAQARATQERVCKYILRQPPRGRPRS